jgi:hypothetical protein
MPLANSNIPLKFLKVEFQELHRHMILQEKYFIQFLFKEKEDLNQ